MSGRRPISPATAERADDESVGSASRSRLTEAISPATTRDLVLNYLVHHCYLDTALAFAGDGTAAGISESSDPRGASRASGSSKKPAFGAGVAPPLLREDSSTDMEIEVDEALAMAAELNGASQSTHSSTNKASNGKGKSKDGLQVSPSTLESPINVGELGSDDIFRISIRRDIRDHILSGRIYAAIELLDEHFPAVVSSSASSGRLRRSDASPQALEPSSIYARLSGGLAGSMSVSNGASSGNGTTSRHSRPKAALPAYRPSLDPDHVALNLQIQAFIEAVRGSSATGISGSVGDASMGGRRSPFSDAGSSAGSTNGSTHVGGAAGGGGIMGALALVQGINTRVLSLPEYWRSMYLKELQGVTALLAYANVESSPVSKYLDQKRRVGLAEQVNSAIIAQSGQPSQPLIESAIRQTTFVWGQIAADKVPVPPSHLAFIGGSAGTTGDPEGFQKLSHLDGGPGAGAANGASSTGASSDPRKHRGRILPPWDLHSFLADR